MSNGYYYEYKKRKKKNSMRSVTFILLLLFTVGLVYLAHVKVAEMKDKASLLQTRIESLENTLATERFSVAAEKVELMKEQSDEFIEQKGREEFNLIKEGDRVYVIRGED